MGACRTLILCVISNFSFEISKNWTFRHRKSVCFHIFMCKGRGKNGGKGMKFIHWFFVVVVLLMRKQKGKGQLSYILQERSTCWRIVFWSSSCEEDWEEGISFVKDNPLKMSVPKISADVVSLLSLQLFYTEVCSHAFSAYWMQEGNQLRERNAGQLL